MNSIKLVLPALIMAFWAFIAISCSNSDEDSNSQTLPSQVTVNDMTGNVTYLDDIGQWAVRVSDEGHTSVYIVNDLESNYRHEKLKVVLSGTAEKNDELSNSDVEYFDLSVKNVRLFYEVSLFGKWQISSYGTDEERKDIKPIGTYLINEEYEQFFTITLNPDHSMTGRTSCNDIKGVFVTDGSEFHFTEYVTTKEGEGIEEYAYVSDRIPRVSAYDIDSAGNLLLYYSDTEYLLLVKLGITDACSSK